MVVSSGSFLLPANTWALSPGHTNLGETFSRFPKNLANRSIGDCPEVKSR